MMAQRQFDGNWTGWKKSTEVRLALVVFGVLSRDDRLFVAGGWLCPGISATKDPSFSRYSLIESTGQSTAMEIARRGQWAADDGLSHERRE